MKTKKFTVRYYEMVQHEEIVEATSSDEAWELATDGVEVEWNQRNTVTDNKTGKVDVYQEEDEDEECGAWG